MSTTPSSPPPAPRSPRPQYPNSPRTPISPRGPLSPRTPISPRRPSPPGSYRAQYPGTTSGPEPTTPHGFVPVTRRDSHTTAGGYEPKTPLSPSFKEEQDLEKAEATARAIDKKDLKLKLRIRVWKVILRSVNFCCSLVVLALVASALVIFKTTQNLPVRSGFPPWAANTPIWPLTLALSIAAVSLVLSTLVLIGYWKGGHRRAEKLSIYWTVFAIGAFIVAIVMWAVSAGVLNGAKAAGEGKDLWGWSCKQNTRSAYFEEDINYKLVCRELDWSFICALIEIGVELLTIAVYAFAFYRIASKRKLRKSMDLRDKARSSYWMAKLREEGEKDGTNQNTAYNAGNGSTIDINGQPKTPVTPGFQLQPPPKSRAHQNQVSLNGTPSLIPTGWQQANGYDPSQVPLPPTPAFAVDNRQSMQVPHAYTSESAIPPTPASVRFNLNPSPPPSRS